jgi:prevent-host-death family protein
MEVPISDAKGQLSDLVRRAEAGDEVILTRHGRVAVQLVPVRRKPTAEQKRAWLDALKGSARGSPGPGAAHAADFLYDDDGLPG